MESADKASGWFARLVRALGMLRDGRLYPEYVRKVEEERFDFQIEMERAQYEMRIARKHRDEFLGFNRELTRRLEQLRSEMKRTQNDYEYTHAKLDTVQGKYDLLSNAYAKLKRERDELREYKGGAL